LETALAAVQCIFGVFLLGGVILSGSLWLYQSNRIPKQVWLTFGTALALFTRSVSELAIITRKNSPDGTTANQTAVAREATFGLFTLAYLVFIRMRADMLTSEDKSLDERQSLEGEVQAWILNRLEIVTEKGILTAPKFGTLTAAFAASHPDQQEKLAYAAHLAAVSAQHFPDS